jgi:Domain of unknown function (DUF2383)
MNTASEHDHEVAGSTDILNSLLQGQLAAVETYDQALIRFEDPHLLADLQLIREEHVQAEILLREKVLELGGEPVDFSGPWASCTAALAGETKATGPATALAALRQGEEHSVNELEEALKHENINFDCKDLIRISLLPTIRKHVADLNRLMGGMA